MNAPLILASASTSRQRILADAGVPFAAEAPHIDEDALKASFLAEDVPPRGVAESLAETKALKISNRYRDTLVLGADQVLVLDGRLFSKVATREAARQVVASLRGRTHQLILATVLAKAGRLVWRHVETADLHMRDFSDGFLEDYLDQEGEDILGSLGCYRIEGRGIQLFADVKGDQFIIRGLPLLPLLGVLREHGIVPA